MLEIEFTPRVVAQIERAAAWWVENRPAAPDAIRCDLEEATSLLAQQPSIGARSVTPKYPDLRRLFLSRVRYHVYYRVTPKKVQIAAFWHASRGIIPSH